MSTARICIVSPEFIGPYPNGGVGTACYWEAFTLGKAGYDVTVLYTGPTERETPEHWESHFAKTAPFRYVDVERAMPASELALLARYDHFCYEARTSELVLAWLRRQRFDLVLFQEFQGHGARALQARHSGHALDGTRAATTLHSCRQWIYEGMKRLPAGPKDLAVDALEKTSARLADQLIAPSHHMAQWAASHWHLGGASVIPYCYDAGLARPAAVVDHAGPFRHLVFFGRLETRKGVHLFCRALANTPALRNHIDQVTFLGKPSSVEGRPSEEFIAAEMGKLPGLRWEIKGDLGSFEAQSWLASQQQMLVVAPSLVDNLPYAVIELHTRRIPFVSTNIGGIPEIVGGSNRHLLAEPTEASLASVIGRACRDGHLTIDYRSGFDVTAANDAHVNFVRGILGGPALRREPHALPAFDVVVTNVSEADPLACVRERAGKADRDLLEGRWLSAGDWQPHASSMPALFIDARVVPDAGCAARLLAALEGDGVDAATSYFTPTHSTGTTTVATPLGASLELGWRMNTFGGPCFAANPSAFSAIASAGVNGSFAFWPSYAAMACAGLSLAMVPASLYAVSNEALAISGHQELEAVFRQYHSRVPGMLDLGWLLKSAFAGLDGGGQADVAALESFEKVGAGRALYDRLISTPDVLLGANAGLVPGAATDPFIRDFATVRDRLGAAIARWRETGARVFIYGAGQHTKMLLAVCPDLGRCLAGVIDRQPLAQFFGTPCVQPDEFRNEMADVIVYSSREFEHEMYARMKDARVEHVLLYRESPPAPEASNSTRLRNRFGHQGADLDALNAMFQPPAWAAGFVSGEDAAFLQEMIAAHEPAAVVEIGVASGVSSAVIRHALDRLPNSESRMLYSCDVRPTCYFNDAYETGQACTEMYADAVGRWQREWRMDASRLIATLPPASIDLTFIDANHSHPWPLLDLLHTTAIAKAGSWVVLHDVDLPIHSPQYQQFGPRWLFEAWPFNKVKGVGRWTSIGAVQIPEDLSQLVPMALALLDKPWGHTPRLRDIGLPPAFDAIQQRLEARLLPLAAELVTK